MKLATILLAAAVTYAAADSCCPDCSDSCPWNGACDDGKNVDCMEEVGGSLACRDNSVCTSIENCDDFAAARKAGYLCSEYPWYNGGYPMDSLSWDTEYKVFSCVNVSDNGNFCDSWNNVENSIDEVAIGNSICTSSSDNGNYCQAWYEHTGEYDKCWNSLVLNSENQLVLQTTCCDSITNPHLLGCCTSNCGASFYNAYPPIQEYANCTCVAEHSSGFYCQQWSCVEYTYSGQTFADGLEVEQYTCLEADSATSTYCQRWNGSAESRSEFELSISTCTAFNVSSSKSYCTGWTTVEHGMDYYWPNLYWTLLPGLLGAFPVFVLQMLLMWEPEKFTVQGTSNCTSWVIVGLWLLQLIWVGTFSVIGIWKTGLAALFYVFIPSLACTMLVTLRLLCFCPKTRRRQGGIIIEEGTTSHSRRNLSSAGRYENALELTDVALDKSAWVAEGADGPITPATLFATPAPASANIPTAVAEVSTSSSSASASPPKHIVVNGITYTATSLYT